MASTKSAAAPANAVNSANAAPGAYDTTAFVDLPIGFDPYWEPTEGAACVCVASEVDARDPSFIRFRMKAMQPTLCKRGNVENAEDVTVAPGDFFTISTYAGITKELFYHVQTAADAVIKLSAKNKVKVKTGPNAGKDVWVFNMQSSPADALRLREGRAAYYKSLTDPSAVKRPQIDDTAST